MLESFFQLACEKHNLTGLSAAIVRDGKTWAGGFDWADREGRQFVSADTAFRLGSVTKLFTATMLMMLVERGVVQLDDAVADYLPRFSMRVNQQPQMVTLRDLATHSAGMPRMMSDPFEMMIADIEGYYAYPIVDELARVQWEGMFRPKTAYEYSNMGYAVLGAALAAAVATPYRQWIADNILAPLKMTNSGFAYDKLTPSAVGYNGQPAFDLLGDIPEIAPIPDIGAFAPAGQLAASARDLLSFLRAFLGDGGLLSADVIATMQTPNTLRDGTITERAIGWQVESVAGETVFSHGGSDYGFTTYMMVVPSRHIALACLCNDGMQHAVMQALPHAALREIL